MATRRGASEAPGDLIIVGEVTRAHGVRGAVRVLPLTDFPQHLLALDRAVLVSGAMFRPVGVEHAEAAGRFVLMKFTGIDAPEEAERLRGATVQIPACDAVPLPPGQFYTFQVIGLEVRTPEGASIGRVVDILRTGSNDVYVVRPPAGAEILLPALDNVIQEIDLDAGRLVARPPEWTS
ncbi:MAG TPA: ribosome maturation factor RimM [bacterium]|nr:ribosome maturation factor RimM [bacterium]